jgi:microsomal dipeptidase-like Zn-dependent dipeptidase
MKRIGIGLLVFATAAAGVIFGLGSQIAERRANEVTYTVAPPTASSEAQALFNRLFIADLHTDSLLWGRDLNVHGDRGHADIPRLIEGRIALQAFTVATKFPISYDPAGTAGDSDILGLLAFAQLWPISTWTSMHERALHQAWRLDDTAARSAGRLTVLRSADDLASFLARHDQHPATIAGFLGLEGAHALERDITKLDALYDAGFRMLGPTHVFDNAVGGSGTGLARGGLTQFGRDVVERAGELGMIIDLAHASEALIDDALEMSDGPFVVSHTGVRGTCDNQRNLSDDHVRRIAAKGGLIAIGFFEVAVCGTGARPIAEALAHVVRIAGPEHAALGSDFDGGVETPFDATGLAYLVDELLRIGLPEHEIKLVMGENTRRFLLDALPPGDRP